MLTWYGPGAEFELLCDVAKHTFSVGESLRNFVTSLHLEPIKPNFVVQRCHDALILLVNSVHRKVLLDMMKAKGTLLVVSIDNLDRCPHREIVKVLEAVHLLLEQDQVRCHRCGGS